MHLALASALALAAFGSRAYSQAIDPTSVSLGIRTTWCTNQKASCPLLCTQITHGDDSTAANDCDPKTLGWHCICSNGITPNASEFSQTIPFYECQQSNQQCANNCDPSDSACVTNCQTARPCGAQDPHRVNITSSASGSSTATGSSTAKATDSSASGSAASTGGSGDGGASESTGFFGAPAATSSSAASANLVAIVAYPLTLLVPELCGLAVVVASFAAGFAILL